MSASEVLLLAFLIGVVAGLRAMTAPAVLAWAQITTGSICIIRRCAS